MAAYKDGMRLADMLRDRIDERGLTDTAAADEMGTSQANVTRWQATTVPKQQHHAALRQFLEVDDDTLGRLLHAQRTRKPTVQELADEVAVIQAEVRELTALVREHLAPEP